MFRAASEVTAMERSPGLSGFARVVRGGWGTALGCLALCLAAGAVEPARYRDLPYATEHERQKLDIYSPPSRQGCPVFFWIHGGGWQAGDKSEVHAKPEALTSRGFVLVSLNYRLLGDGVTIDRMAADLAKGIRWFSDRAPDYGGDRRRIFIGGHSAGAQLAALLCTDARYLEAEGIPLKRVRGCIPVDGDTYDVPLQIATVEQRIADIYRRKFGSEAEQRNLSPVTHAVRGKRLPPFLILHVAEHPEVRLQSRTLAEKLRSAGARAEVVAAAGKTHASINAELGMPGDPPSEALFRFLRAHR